MTAGRRVYVIGAPGSGKTTFAARLAARTGAPVFHLDNIYRVGGGNGPERSADERATDVGRILAKDEWIAEGVHLGWTQPLINAATHVVWLDQSFHQSTLRMLKRSIGLAVAEARRRKGRERFLRFRDYARKLREFRATVAETRDFSDDEIESALSASKATVIRCRTSAEVNLALDTVSG